MKYFKKLVGDRIYLSPRNVDDLEIFVNWLNDFETTDYLGGSGNLVTLQSEKEYLEKNATEQAAFVIVTLDSNQMIGSISLNKLNANNKSATLGIFIGDKDYRSKGYGTEAIKLLLDYGFNYMNLHHVNLTLMSFNQRALNCYKKAGFKECGKIRECNYIDGKYYDSIVMDILKDEFTEKCIRNRNI